MPRKRQSARPLQSEPKTSPSISPISAKDKALHSEESLNEKKPLEVPIQRQLKSPRGSQEQSVSLESYKMLQQQGVDQAVVISTLRQEVAELTTMAGSLHQEIAALHAQLDKRLETQVTQHNDLFTLQLKSKQQADTINDLRQQVKALQQQLQQQEERHSIDLCSLQQATKQTFDRQLEEQSQLIHELQLKLNQQNTLSNIAEGKLNRWQLRSFSS